MSGNQEKGLCDVAGFSFQVQICLSRLVHILSWFGCSSFFTAVQCNSIFISYDLSLVLVMCAIQHGGAVEVTESSVSSWSELDSTANMSIKPCSMFISSQCSVHCCSWSHWVTSGVSEWSCVHWTAHCLHFASSSPRPSLSLSLYPTISIYLSPKWWTTTDKSELGQNSNMWHNFVASTNNSFSS